MALSLIEATAVASSKESVLYPFEGAQKIAASEALDASKFSESWVKVDDTTSVRVWTFPGKAESNKAIIFFHGNGQRLETSFDFTFNMAQITGAEVIVFDYPGYGSSTGSPNQESLTRSGVAVARDFLERNSSKSINLVGFSLGSAVASQVALVIEPNRISHLILMAPWSSFGSRVGSAGRMFFKNLVQNNPWDSLSAVQNLELPILIIHGKEDKVIPVNEGMKLARVMKNSRSSTLWLDGLGHSEILNPDVLLFLSEYLK